MFARCARSACCASGQARWCSGCSGGVRGDDDLASGEGLLQPTKPDEATLLGSVALLMCLQAQAVTAESGVDCCFGMGHALGRAVFEPLDEILQADDATLTLDEPGVQLVEVGLDALEFELGALVGGGRPDELAEGFPLGPQSLAQACRGHGRLEERGGGGRLADVYPFYSHGARNA